ncbi:hypothetical protein [Pseudofrankia inefficax]|uniref:hypothetical protein n=1 Tax=Pseudofrankia inefficax (strain DSM 45817 / CECT 9037 / DDB 130130 / EuI1c) TaxID=298654 RepID=UPI0002EB594F|nr:hypothetical protein [Pseudofrankia inefficax]
MDRHVRGCAVCQQTVVALRGVRVELARLAPVSMPPDVARRIQEALTAAPLPSVPSTSGGRRGGPGERRSAAGRRAADRRRRPMATHGVTPLRPPDHSTMLSRAARPERLMFLAVCLLVVVAGGGLVVALHHAQSSSSAASTAGGPAVVADREDSADSAAVAPNAVAAGTASEGTVTLANASPVQSFRIATSRAALAPANVAQHARDLLAGRVPAAATAPFAATAAASASASWAAVATPALLACYQELVDTTHSPLLAVDEVSYRGRDAVLVVLDLPDGESTAPSPAATPVGPAAAAPDAALVPASRDRIQLTIVDLGCDVGRLPAATLFAEQSTKAA